MAEFERIEVRTRSGWAGELRVIEERGAFVVKVALYLRRGWLSPFFEVDRFDDPDEASIYAHGIKDAIERGHRE